MICPNCRGVLDENGKCLGCGTVTKMKLGEGGIVMNAIPEEIVDKLAEVGNINAVSFEELKETMQNVNNSKKLPTEQFLIDSCKHCLDANGNRIVCNQSGVNTERFNIVCTYCSHKERR